MEVRTIRAQMRAGKSIFDLPLRVTFYARVSTEKFEQQSSLENQIQYYTELITGKPNWTYIAGYIDEGISGTSTKKRDSFNRMIADAKAGRFDFIITKEISRFSRSTLDSIKYTQELLDNNVGVLFQSDNINTLDPDSEFRLVVMAGVAQDEVRKLSERLKFGFRQSIKNGRVLGNDRIWGYDKKDCKLSVNEREAEAVRLIFELYANHGMGIRRVSQKLYDMGYTNRTGGEFNVLTIRNILQNPKYKGWYCGSKSQSIDYRSKKTVFLDQSEWVTHPDPAIPAIVPEELWDRANAIYNSRSTQMLGHASGAVFHNRYAYSGKIFCEEHGTAFHRQLLESRSGGKEVWQCRVYRQRGRAGCSSPQLRTCELNEIMGGIFSELCPDRNAIVSALLELIRLAPDEHNYGRDIERLEADIEQICAKKDRLLELNLGGAIDWDEFKIRNDGFNRQLAALRQKVEAIKEEAAKRAHTGGSLSKVKTALEEDLSFEHGINSELVAAILNRITVKKDSKPGVFLLEIFLKSGLTRSVRCERTKTSFRYNCYLYDKAKGILSLCHNSGQAKAEQPWAI